MTAFAPLPTGPFQIVYADPPWQHTAQIRDGTVGKASDHYATVPTATLCELPVRECVDRKALLFLWAASPLLPDAMRVGMAWGFEYSTVAFVWHKQNITPGCYTLSSCELCLVFRGGGIPQPRGARNVRQFVDCKRGKHSAKPLEVRERIAEMFPRQRKLELFARPQGLLAAHEGWTLWGNEVVDAKP